MIDTKKWVPFLCQQKSQVNIFGSVYKTVHGSLTQQQSKDAHTGFSFSIRTGNQISAPFPIYTEFPPSKIKISFTAQVTLFNISLIQIILEPCTSIINISPSTCLHTRESQ